MKFLSIDCHIAVAADIKNIFTQLGHTVDRFLLYPNFQWLINEPVWNSEELNRENWMDITESTVDRFYLNHKSKLDHYDGFICAYPIYFLKLFEKFNKPIILACPIRYEYPLYDNRITWLEDSLKNNPNIIKVANNQFDQKYCEKFLGNKWEWIPSLCEYTNIIHSKKHKNFIVSGFHNPPLGNQFQHKFSLGQHSWDTLFNHEGIVHFPYNASQMSIFEQNTAQVPLAFPSLDFAIELFHKHADPSAMKGGTFSQLTWPNTFPDRRIDQFINKEWLSYSDFYNGTINCQYFNSLDDINESFNNFSPHPNQSNKDLIFSKWTKILQSI